MRLRGLFGCALLWFGAAVAFAQDANESLQQQIAAQLAAHPITRGHFAQSKTLPFLTKPLLSDGRFLYHARQGVLWQVEHPVASTLVIDDAGLFQNGRRLVSGGGAMGTVKEVFQGLLGGQLQSLRNYFELTASGNAQQWQLHLKPKSGPLANALTAVELRGGDALNSLAMTEPQGAQTRITFTAVEHPAALTSAEQQEFDRAR